MDGDDDILKGFDAVLPRLEPYGPRSVPAAGHRQYAEHQRAASDRRTELGIFAALTAALGGMTWLAWMPWVPLWILVPMAVGAALSGAATAHRFLLLAFGQRLEQALPAGTDAKTAQLEDGTWSLIRYWNADVFVWNRKVEALRSEVILWMCQRNVPEARGIEWPEHGSDVRAQALFAEIQGLVADRAALAARKAEIEHRLRGLDARLHQLKAADEKIVAALPPGEPQDPTDDG